MSDSLVPTQEIRFAVVMYGGVSLAIYIHGVAQELLRLARSTSGARKLDSVESIYLEMSHKVRPVEKTLGDDVQPTRFVVDILSGTSAGGINAIFLAKALAIGAENLDNLRDTWLDVADIDKLLNLSDPDQPKRSLLNGNWMYSQLYQAFTRMNDPANPNPAPPPELDQLDLFVTTTDLNGVAMPMRLTDMNIVEKVHKGYFHFRLDNFSLTNSKEDEGLNDLRRNDFASFFDPMLAFAARATSSFPVAFAPIKLADIQPFLGPARYAAARPAFQKFFRWIPNKPLVEVQEQADIEERELADGGYLNNKPFDHVIDALTFRPSRLPHSRKLLFVDPFPELAGKQKDQKHFNFKENALDAAVTLPRYQTIRQELERIQDLNRTLLRLGEIHDRTASRPRTQMRPFAQLTLQELSAQYGSAYITYHSVRLFDTTDDLAGLISSMHETAADDDLFLAVRYLVRAWRTATYSADGNDGKLPETRFLMDFDYSFRLRRAIHLLEWARTQPHADSTCKSLIRQITRLLRKHNQLSSVADTNPLAAHLRTLAAALTWDSIKSILTPVTDDERAGRAMTMYASIPALKGFAETIAAEWNTVFDANRKELDGCRQDAAFNERYSTFDYRDMISLAFLEGSNVSEHTETEIYRVSPADSTKTHATEQINLESKLAGYKLGDFGAFLDRDFRLNDMLFGRLDAAERIVSAIFNQECDEDLKQHYIERLRLAIIQQERDKGMNALTPVLTCGLEAAKALQNHYHLAPGPQPKDSARQIAHASYILGRMFEDDLHESGSIVSMLQTVGKIAATLVSFLIPQSLGGLFLRHWLSLIALASLLLYALAFLTKQPRLEILGLYGLGVSFLLWLLAWLAGSYLTSTRVPRWFKVSVATLSAVAIISVVLSGVHHVWPDLIWIWNALLKRLHEIA
jgi:patatin-related protein